MSRSEWGVFCDGELLQGGFATIGDVADAIVWYRHHDGEIYSARQCPAHTDCEAEFCPDCEGSL